VVIDGIQASSHCWRTRLHVAQRACARSLHATSGIVIEWAALFGGARSCACGRPAVAAGSRRSPAPSAGVDGVARCAVSPATPVRLRPHRHDPQPTDPHCGAGSRTPRHRPVPHRLRNWPCEPGLDTGRSHIQQMPSYQLYCGPASTWTDASRRSRATSSLCRPKVASWLPTPPPTLPDKSA
jgi:hypothetical protein